MRSPDGRITLLEDATAQPMLIAVKHLSAHRDNNILIADSRNHRAVQIPSGSRKGH